MTKAALGNRLNPPRGWREGHDSSLACPHRDLSVCPDCEKANPEALDVYGAHFWIPLDQRPALKAEAMEALYANAKLIAAAPELADRARAALRKAGRLP